MSIYLMRPCYPNDGTWVDFEANNGKLTSELYGTTALGFSRFSGISSDSQFEEFKEKKACSDFLYCVAPFPIFSQKAVEVLSDIADISFVNILIDDLDGFFLGIIHASREFIDLERSRYRNLTNGDKIISASAYKEPTEHFNIARDINHSHEFVVSSSFVNLCKKNALNIIFKKVELGKPQGFFDR